MESRLLSVASGSSPLETIVQLSSAALIIFEHSFYIFDKQRYSQDQQQSGPYIRDALEQYMVSPHAAAVKGAVSTAVRKYQEAVSTIKNKPSTWKAKLPFERSRRKAQQSFELSERKTELMKTVLEITSQYRLPRP